MSSVKEKITELAGKVYSSFGSVAQEKTERAAAEKTYTPEMQNYFQNLASDLGLEISGGTDFHAKMKPHIEIGIGQGDMAVPYYVLERIKMIHAESN